MADEATTTETTETGGDGAAAVAAGKTFTQDDVNRIVGERLSKERQQYADYDDLKTKASEFDKLSESQKTEAQKALDRATKAEQRAQAAETSLLRYQVATAKGVPADAVDLLHGATQEELEAQADRILSLTQANRTGFDGGTRGSDAPPSDMNHMLRRAAGRT